MKLLIVRTAAALGVALFFPPAALAQSANDDGRARSADALQPLQQRAGAAYRALQKAESDTKLAGQDLVARDAEHRAAQKQVEEARKSLETARKSLAAARDREAKLRKTYDDAVNAVSAAAPANRK